MITGLEEILTIGEQRGCAIPAFNVYNLESLMGVMAAAEETASPVIFMMYSRLFNHINGALMAPAIVEAVRRLATPAVFYLDHGPGIAEVIRALRYGVSGVMIDASS